MTGMRWLRGGDVALVECLAHDRKLRCLLQHAREFLDERRAAGDPVVALDVAVDMSVPWPETRAGRLVVGDQTAGWACATVRVGMRGVIDGVTRRGTVLLFRATSDEECALEWTCAPCVYLLMQFSTRMAIVNFGKGIAWQLTDVQSVALERTEILRAIFAAVGFPDEVADALVEARVRSDYFHDPTTSSSSSSISSTASSSEASADAAAAAVPDPSPGTAE